MTAHLLANRRPNKLVGRQSGPETGESLQALQAVKPAMQSRPVLGFTHHQERGSPQLQGDDYMDDENKRGVSRFELRKIAEAIH